VSGPVHRGRPERALLLTAPRASNDISAVDVGGAQRGRPASRFLSAARTVALEYGRFLRGRSVTGRGHPSAADRCEPAISANGRAPILGHVEKQNRERRGKCRKGHRRTHEDKPQEVDADTLSLK
jgi:hypothetical protein